MPGEWTHGLCGCFGSCTLCILSYLVPCYVMGRNASALGDSFCLYCCFSFIPIVNVVARFTQRGKIRMHQQIDGGTCGDIVAVLCCPFCALVQEAQEVDNFNVVPCQMART